MTTPTTATADTILAIDLGPDKFVASVHHRSTAAASFDIIPTDRAELLRLLDRHRPAVVVIEACALAGCDLPPFYGPGAVRVGSTVTDGPSGRRSAAESARGTIAPYSAGVRYPNAL